MSFQSDFFTYLASRGTPIGDRFYPLTLPEGEGLPACTVQRISGPRDTTHQGRTGHVNGARYQLTVYDSTHDGARAARDALITAIEGFRGMMGSTAVGGIIIEDDRDDKEEDSGLYKWMIDALIGYQEA